MKQIILFLLFSLQLQAQTSYKAVDIDAMAGTKYETLLTNITNVYIVRIIYTLIIF